MGRTNYIEHPDEGSDDFFANPIALCAKPFLVDAILPDGSSIPAGEIVLELEFTRKLHHFETRRDTVNAFLAEIATDLEDDQRNGVNLPEHIAGYTFARLARLAERAFGFVQVELTLPSLPEVLATDPLHASYTELGIVLGSIQENSGGRGEPTVVHMFTSAFIARYAQMES